MQLTGRDLAKRWRFETSRHNKLFNFGYRRSSSQFFQRTRYSRGMGSSQPSFFRQSSCIRIFASNTKGETNRRGSYTELTNERIPLLVGGLSLILILNTNTSRIKFHSTPRAFSIDGLSKQRSLTELALSDAGNKATTFSLLQIHLVKRNPPFAKSSQRSLANRWLHPHPQQI